MEFRWRLSKIHQLPWAVEGDLAGPKSRHKGKHEPKLLNSAGITPD